MGQDTFTSDAMSKWKGMKSYTLAVAEAMPEKKFNYKPVQEEGTFEEQLVHIANNIYNLSSRFLRDTLSPVNMKSIVEKVSNNALTV
jgi:hypothetical protein